MSRCRSLCFLLTLFVAPIQAQSGPDRVITSTELEASGLNRLADVFEFFGIGVPATTDSFNYWPRSTFGFQAAASPLAIEVDGVRHDIVVYGMPLYNALPVTIPEIQRIDVYRSRLEGDGSGASRGLVRIVTKKEEGYSVGFTLGNQTGDPGPLRYLDPTLRNVDKIGPDYQANARWQAHTASILYREDFATEPPLAARNGGVLGSGPLRQRIVTGKYGLTADRLSASVTAFQQDDLIKPPASIGSVDEQLFELPLSIRYVGGHAIHAHTVGSSSVGELRGSIAVRSITKRPSTTPSSAQSEGASAQLHVLYRVSRLPSSQFRYSVTGGLKRDWFGTTFGFASGQARLQSTRMHAAVRTDADEVGFDLGLSRAIGRFEVEAGHIRYTRFEQRSFDIARIRAMVGTRGLRWIGQPVLRIEQRLKVVLPFDVLSGDDALTARISGNVDRLRTNSDARARWNAWIHGAAQWSGTSVFRVESTARVLRSSWFRSWPRLSARVSLQTALGSGTSFLARSRFQSDSEWDVGRVSVVPSTFVVDLGLRKTMVDRRLHLSLLLRDVFDRGAQSHPLGSTPGRRLFLTARWMV